MRLEIPPLAWGKHVGSRPGIPVDGNTPTCVGKTSKMTRPTSCIRKYPHLRGENFKDDQTNKLHPEIPPLAWGKHLKRNKTLADFGNTPTCVGKTGRNQHSSV